MFFSQKFCMAQNSNRDYAKDWALYFLPQIRVDMIEKQELRLFKLLKIIAFYKNI